MLFRSRPDSMHQHHSSPSKPRQAISNTIRLASISFNGATTCWIRTKINTPIQSNQLLWKRIMQTKRNTLSLRLLQSSGRNEFTQFDGAYANGYAMRTSATRPPTVESAGNIAMKRQRGQGLVKLSNTFLNQFRFFCNGWPFVLLVEI